jgi:putative endonuclease
VIQERRLQHSKQPAVYILASRRNGTLYVGVTSALPARMEQHEKGLIDGFSMRYRVHALVYFEMHFTMAEAIRREKQIKKWNRLWKIRLIEQVNPEWENLYSNGHLRDLGQGGQEC